MSRRDSTRRITYSAVCVALGVVAVLLSQFTSAQVVPLILVSLCVYIAFMRCGAVYGAITAAATVLVAFFVCGISLTFVFLCALFVPYAVAAFLMKRLTYAKTYQAIIRIIITAVLFCVSVILTVYLTDFVVGTRIGDLMDTIGKIPTALIITVVTLPVDPFFYFASSKILKLLK